jgi:glycerol-1-phosphate dehydrogenase [NAD(P)+]
VNGSEPSTEPLAQLARGEWIDPDVGAPRRLDMPSIAIEDTLRGREAELVAALDLGRRLAVLSDATTRGVLGARVERALAPLARIDSIVLPSAAHADMRTVDAIRAHCGAVDGLIAVGSGTINDLAKFVAAREGKRYAVFATAPSMNGYTSANAAITVNGHKKTLPATLARGVFVDLSVFAAAPPRMIRAGLGDSLCRSTAQVDWLLSHHLLGTDYRTAPFALLESDEAVLLDAPDALLAGDLDAMRALARTLLLSGIGMTLCGGSFPASQGEHLISHYLDMRPSAGASAPLHGEQVGVATLAMARLQHALLDAPAPRLGPTSTDEPALQRHFGDALGAACWRDFLPKRLDEARAAALTERAAAQWDTLRARARAAQVPVERLASALRRAGAPVTCTDIGVEPAHWAAAVRHARFLRDRYTFLDLADDAGLLDSRFLH